MIETKIAIIGAGLNGLAAANIFKDSIIIDGNINFSDQRTSAISYGSTQLLKKADIFEEFLSFSGKINKIDIIDQNSSFILNYDHKLIGSNPMGYICHNSDLKKLFFKNISSSRIINSFYNKIEFGNKILIHTDNEVIKADFLIAADGKFSKIRQLLNIKLNSHDYKQTAITFDVSHDKPHNNVAIENFHKNGPFAILPLKDQNQSSIVWTESTEFAKQLLNSEEIENYFANKFSKFLGNHQIISKISSYPLSLTYANQYAVDNIFLIGDSAHSIHPIAGQGFNLGVRDILSLESILNENIDLGLGFDNIAQKYQNARIHDNESMIFATHIINDIFCKDFLPIKIARRLGLGAIEKSSFLKKLLIKSAMG